MKPSPDGQYRVEAFCHVCSKKYLARYNIGRRAKVCTPPRHVCRKGKKNGRPVPCVEECCRSKYRQGAAASAMDSAIDRRKVLADAEYDKAMKAAAKLKTRAGRAINFMGITGCRLGESLLVRRRNLYFQTGKLSTVKIPTLKRKGRPARTVDLLNANPYVRILRSWSTRMKPDALLFPVASRTVQLALEGILDRIKPDREALAHIFRHTRASQLIAAGADWNYVRQQLGWSSLEMAKIYTHVLNQDRIVSVLEDA